MHHGLMSSSLRGGMGVSCASRSLSRLDGVDAVQRSPSTARVASPRRGLTLHAIDAARRARGRRHVNLTPSTRRLLLDGVAVTIHTG